MKLLKTAALLCALTLPAFASTPTATLTDTDGTAWANCSYSATLTILGSTSTPAPTVSGVTVSPLTVTGSCSASGAISPTLTDTSTVDQPNAQWVFTIQSNTSAGPVKVSTPVVGSAPNLSKTFSLLPAPRFATGANAYGYADSEIQGVPQIGATYYNVTTPCLKQYSLAGWTCGGGGGGSAPATPSDIGTLYAFGDSTFGGIAGSTQSDFGTIGILSDDFPGATYNFAVGGTEMPNIVSLYLKYFPAGITATTRIPTIVSNGGINDANNRGVNGINNYSLALNAGIAWVLTPPANKVMASTCTATGTWAAETTVMALNSANLGTGRVSTTNGSTLSCVVPSNNGQIGVTWGVSQAASGGTYTVAIDGVNQINSCSSTTTFTSTWCTTVINSNTVNRQSFAVSAGTHTVLITVTSSTGAGNPVYILDVDSNPSSTVGQPNFIMSGVLRQAADNLASTTAAYNTADLAVVNGLATQNYNVAFADVRDTGNPGVNVTTDMANAANINSPCQGGAAPLHPNNCGYLNYALTLENTAKTEFQPQIFYPGSGVSYAKFGNLRVHGAITSVNGSIAITQTASLGSPSNWLLTNASSPIDNATGLTPNGTYFAPGICFYQNCSANVTGAGLTYDPSNSRYFTALVSTFSMGFQHCAVNTTTGPASCRTDLYTDPTTGTVTTPQGFNGIARGMAKLVAGTVTVATTAAATPTATLTYQLTSCIVSGSGAPGVLSVGTVTAGTSFVINSSVATDTSNVCWVIF